MTNRSLLHILLLISLLFSELAVSVHLVGHLHEHEHSYAHEEDGNALMAWPASTELQRHKDQASDHTVDATDTVIGDCTIYHVYSALQACLPHVLGPAAEQFLADAASPIRNADVAASALAASRIRGPPLIS